MYSFWRLLLLCICGTFLHTEAAKSRAIHSGRIPSNVQIYPKSKLEKSHHRPVSSAERRSIQQSSHLRGPNSESKVSASLGDLLPEHKVLHQRAIQKDYDFAQFGQTCKVLTADELEAFLGIFQESIEPHDGETHLQGTNPQEMGKYLEQLFNHSRAICDFRNLLTCHKNLLTCACVHPSMGANRDGVCGINVGHPCEISGKTLLKHGLPMTMSEMSPIKCLLENAECVMPSENERLGAGVSPIRKVCKCRTGFNGATCSRRYAPDGRSMLSSVNRKEDGGYSMKKTAQTDTVSEEVDVGRPIWMDEIGVVPGEYFMHPEDIRDQLVELMDEEEMYAQEIRVKEAEKLVRNMEMDVDKEEMVVHQLHLRKLAHLQHGETCDPESQVILDNPPVSKDAAQRWTDPQPQDIKFWQLVLLQTKKPLCNTHRLLRCNEATKVCECKPGLELDPQGKKSLYPCKIPFGHNCEMDFGPILEFNPLNDRKRFSEMSSPVCMPGTECMDKPLFFQKKCWCSSKFNCDQNVFDEDYFTKMISAIKSRFTLKLGDSCDPKLHESLLSYRTDENPGHEKRLTLFKEIIENPESRLCDIENYLNCSDGSRTCECWKQLQPAERDNGEYDCVAMNMASCGRTFKPGKYLYTRQGSQLWQVEKTFSTKQFLPGCVPGAKCIGGNNPKWAGRCLCTSLDKSGKKCTEDKSVIASVFRADLIPNDDTEEMDILHVYFDLNTQTTLMEHLMTSEVNDVCDPSTGLTLDRLMKFWREIANASSTDGEQQTLQYFVAATKWTKFLVSSVQGKTASLCNAKIGLRCHRTTGRCGCRRGSRWIGNKCFLEEGEYCVPQPGASWVLRCMEKTVCSPIQKEHYTAYKCVPCNKKKGEKECVATLFEDKEEIWDIWNVHDDDDGVVVEKKKPNDNVIYSKGVEIPSVGEEKLNEVDIIQGRSGNNGFVVGANKNDKEKAKKYTAKTPVKTTADTHKHNNLAPQSPEVTKEPHTVDGLTLRQKTAYLLEILRMVKEILLYRNIPFGESCKIEDEEKLNEVFPTLPVYDMKNLPTSIPMTYAVLSRLYWKGISFCNRNMFLKCTHDAVCGCSFGFGLVEEDGECRLKERSYCDRESLHVGKRSIDFVSETENDQRNKHPLFQCQSGTQCTQIDYGLPVCVRNDKEDEEDENVKGKQSNKGMTMGRSFHNSHSSSNNDPSYFRYEENAFRVVTTESTKRSGSPDWGPEQVHFLGIGVVVRMFITWAFV